MKKVFKRRSVPVEPQDEPQVEPEVMDPIAKMQQQLNSLEAKIDTLIGQSRPFQRYDNSQRFDRGSQESSFRDRSFSKAICADCHKECEVPFKPSGGRPVYCKACFANHQEGSGSFKDKFERAPREGAFSKFRSFDKRPGREDHSRSGGRRKPAFRKSRARD